MSSLFDIARSGIRTYQQALAVTAQNIANVNTDGYARQEVRLTDVTGAAPTATAAGSGGGGVELTDVVRAFSDLLADSTRGASSAHTAAQQRADSAAAIESWFTPGQGGIDEAMTDFYQAMTRLSGSPASLPLRQVVLQAGAALAGQISDVANGLQTLRDGIGRAAEVATAQVNGMLDQLAALNQDFHAARSSGMDTNALASQRDQLLNELGEKIGITTALDGRGRVTVKLTGSGATVLDAEGARTLSAELGDRLALNTGERTASVLRGGTIGGLSDALGMLDQAVAELDNFAGSLAQAANAMQAGGTDLEGAAGQAMFRMTGWSADAGLTNAGTATVALSQTADAAPAGPITLTMGAGGVWTARGADGAALGSGTETIQLDGLTLTLDGAGADGDSFTITRQDGHAADLAFMLDGANDIAAATRMTLHPVSGNAGTATVSLAPVQTAAAGVTGIEALLADGSTAADAVELIGAGIAGLVADQGGTLDLASLGTPSRATFAADAASLAGATALRLTTDAGTVTFDLTTLADGTARPAGWGAAQIAAALDDGRLTTASGMTLADLGAYAAGNGGQLQVALATGDISAARLTLASGNLDAAVAGAEPAGGSVQIFTRNGVHVAGTPLTAAEAADLLTEANGFLPGAVYDASHLNQDYRGTDVIALAVPGAQTAELPMGGLVAAASGALSPVAARDVTVAMTGQGSAGLTVPEGASAAQAAELLNAALPGLGATATTAVMLQATDGQLSFELSGENSIPVTITAMVSGGDMSAVAAKINAQTDATGLRAEVSPEGGRLLLVSDTGATIDFGHFTGSFGAKMTVTEAAPDGALLSGAATLGGGAAAVRVTGRVTLQAATDFTATAMGSTVQSAADPAIGGLFSLTTADAGATQDLAIRFDPALDGASTNAGVASAAGTSYSVTLGGKTVMVSAAVIGATSGEDVAAALADALRAGTPDAELTGAPVSALPANGTTLELEADGQTYTLTMVAGAPVVTGPEEGRITATLGAGNAITLSMTGSADGSGIRVKDPGSVRAASFGLGTGAMQHIQGQAVSAAALPAGGAQLPVTINGTSHFLTVAASGPGVVVTTPAGFPGSATVDADGAISLWVPQDAGQVSVGSMADAGFSTLGAAVGADGSGLTVTGADGAVPDLGFTAESSVTQRLSLDGLPPEELLVGMTGSGALQLAGGATAGTTTEPQLMLEVVDAAQGEVALLDAETGDRIASGFLDDSGQATIGGYAVTMGPGAVTGDRYELTSASAGSGDGANLQALLTEWSGTGGLTEQYNMMVSDVGSQTSAAETAETAAAARLTAAQTAEANMSSVDLDTEAARLLQLQQAYQGNAKALTVAQELFDTLLKAI